MSLYLVTGGAGFIGSHLAEELTRRGERVRVVDSLITGHRKNLAHLPASSSSKAISPTPRCAKRAVQGVDYVLHQAAIPSVPRSVEDPITSNRANVDATLERAGRRARCRRQTRRLCRIVVCLRQYRTHCRSARTCRRNPLSPYALQKLVGEQYMQMFTALYGLETVTIRYFNVFGPRQDPSSPYSGVISVFAKALLENKVADDLRRRRTDARLHVHRERRRWRAPRRRRAGRVRTGHQRRHRIAHLAESFCSARCSDLVGSRVNVSYGPVRSGDVKDSQADITRARKILGYKPIVSFEEGLRQTLEWYRAEADAMTRR